MKPANLCPTKAPALNLRGDYASPGKLTFGRPLPDFNPSGPIPFTVPAKSAPVISIAVKFGRSGEQAEKVAVAKITSAYLAINFAA